MAVTSYATLDELRAVLQNPATALNDEIELSIAAASRAIDNQTGRRFWAPDEAETRLYTPVSAGYLYLDDFFELDEDAFMVGDSLWTLGEDFALEQSSAARRAGVAVYDTVRALSRHSPRFTPGAIQSISVTAKFGWPAVPDDIRSAVRVLAARLFRRPKEAAFGIVGAGLEGSAVAIVRNDPDLHLLLEPYTRSAMVE